MSFRILPIAITLFLCLGVLASPNLSQAANIKGVLERSPLPARTRTLGYARTRVTSAAEGTTTRQRDVALFLAAEKSHTIPPAKAHAVIYAEGLRLNPSVVSCAVDGKIVFQNEHGFTLTVVVGEERIQIGPGEAKSYGCQAEASGKHHSVRVEEWPHMRAAMYVGEIGVPALLNAKGQFTLAAPPGTYELQVVTSDAIIYRQPVRVARTDLNLGRIGLSEGAR